MYSKYFKVCWHVFTKNFFPFFVSGELRCVIKVPNKPEIVSSKSCDGKKKEKHFLERLHRRASGGVNFYLHNTVIRKLDGFLRIVLQPTN